MKKGNKALIILGIIFAAAALIFLVLGFALSGADIIGWFSSKWAMRFYTFAVVYGLVVLLVFISGKINRL